MPKDQHDLKMVNRSTGWKNREVFPTPSAFLRVSVHNSTASNQRFVFQEMAPFQAQSCRKTTVDWCFVLLRLLIAVCIAPLVMWFTVFVVIRITSRRYIPSVRLWSAALCVDLVCFIAPSQDEIALHCTITIAILHWLYYCYGRHLRFFGNAYWKIWLDVFCERNESRLILTIPSHYTYSSLSVAMKGISDHQPTHGYIWNMEDFRRTRPRWG